MKRLLMTIVAASAAMCTSLTADASGITVDSVVQRWPFNNKVDITYTVSGGQDAANGLFCRIVFTASVDSVAYEIDGRKIGANASDGRHVATWTLPAGLKATGCTMTAHDCLSPRFPNASGDRASRTMMETNRNSL